MENEKTHHEPDKKDARTSNEQNLTHIIRLNVLDHRLGGKKDSSCHVNDTILISSQISDSQLSVQGCGCFNGYLSIENSINTM